MRAGRALMAQAIEGRHVHKGHVISGAGHLGLIVWVLVGGSFAPAPEPFEVTEVAVISGEEFAAMVAGAGAPKVTDAVAAPEAPAETPITAPEPPRPEPRPEPLPEPPKTEAPLPETPPEALPQPQEAEVSSEPPVIAPPPQETVVLSPETSDRPVPRPVPRVAPIPVAQHEPDTKAAEAPQEAVSPEKAPEAETVEEQDAAQPEEATTQIATEADQKPAAAPVSSMRPKTRPAAAKPTEKPTEKPAEKPAETAAAKPTEKPAAQDAVNSALAEALAGATAPADASGTGAAASGPPMTAGEKDALRVAVQQCWNVGALSSDALRVTVTVVVEMNEDGKPNTGSIRMLGFEGGSDAAAGQAYEAARRAIIRCGASGFNLPREKYDHWREIEMVFNPEKMRIK